MANNFEGVYEANGKCYIKWQEGKKRRSKALNFAYTKAGIEKAYKIRAQLIKAYQQGFAEEDRGPAPTFQELAQTRLDTAPLTKETRRTQKSYLNNYWIPPFADARIDTIQYTDLLSEFTDVINGSVEPKTAKHIFSAGSAVFKLAIKSRWRVDNPVELISEEVSLEKKKIDPFTREERAQILDSLDEHQHLFYAIRFFTGMRPSEVIALRWSDYRNGTFSVTKARVRGVDGLTKTKTERDVPVHPFVRKLLSATPRQLHDNHILVNQHQVSYQSADHLAKTFTATLKKLGIRHRSPYNVRHTAATMMLEAGMKPAYCAKILGHSLQMFFSRYAEWIDKDESETQARIWADFA